MHDAVDYLFALSDAELVLYWSLFGEYPTPYRHQRARLAELVGLTVQEPPVMTVRDRQRLGGATYHRTPAKRKTA